MARRAIRDLFREVNDLRDEIRALSGRLPTRISLESCVGGLPASRPMYAEAAEFYPTVGTALLSHLAPGSEPGDSFAFQAAAGGADDLIRASAGAVLRTDGHFGGAAESAGASLRAAAGAPVRAGSRRWRRLLAAETATAHAEGLPRTSAGDADGSQGEEPTEKEPPRTPMRRRARRRRSRTPRSSAKSLRLRPIAEEEELFVEEAEEQTDELVNTRTLAGRRQVLPAKAPEEECMDGEATGATSPKRGRASEQTLSNAWDATPLASRLYAESVQPLALRACALMATRHIADDIPIGQIYASLEDLGRVCSFALTGDGLHHAYREHLAGFFAYLVEVDYEAFCEETREVTLTKFT